MLDTVIPSLVLCMPLIHIKSLPLPDTFDVTECIQGISRHFSTELSIDEIHITITWSWLPARHYLLGGTIFEMQTTKEPPLLVELVIPDFHSQEVVQHMLQCIAESLAHFAGIEKESIFIYCSKVVSGAILDDGKIVEW